MNDIQLSTDSEKRGVIITRGDKTVTISYQDIIQVLNRDCDEVLLDNNARVDVLNTGRTDMEYCIRRVCHGCVKSSFRLSRTEWNKMVELAFIYVSS